MQKNPSGLNSSKAHLAKKGGRIQGSEIHSPPGSAAVVFYYRLGGGSVVELA